MVRQRRFLRPVLLAATALVLAGVVTLVAAVTMGGTSPDAATGQAAAGQPAAAVDPAAIADAGALIANLQARLRVTPKDERSWSNLALAYVEQARITADPTYYPKAEQAIARAQAIAPDDSVMFAARATLLTARHDFAGARRAADRALSINPYSAQAAAIRSDALTELGQYAAARRAAERADSLFPGPSTFARLSYQAELRGDLTDATRLMSRSEEGAGRSAASYAFAAFHLGELARASGNLKAAAHQYDNALAAEPTYMPALAGRARLAVARGGRDDIAAAERDYARVVRRLPLTEYIVELGELYETTGRTTLARQQYAVAVATARIAKANGVTVDLETALFQADHGSPAEALAAAHTEWSRRHSIHTADALGWALHAAGRDRVALRYARLANRLGTRDARLIYHLGAIEAALGLPPAAEHLRDARDLDAGVNPWRERGIQALLRGLQ